jgi:hypothetical protein
MQPDGESYWSEPSPPWQQRFDIAKLDFETLVNTVKKRHSGLWSSIKCQDAAMLGGEA